MSKTDAEAKVPSPIVAALSFLLDNPALGDTTRAALRAILRPSAEPSRGGAILTSAKADETVSSFPDPELKRQIGSKPVDRKNFLLWMEPYFGTIDGVTAHFRRIRRASVPGEVHLHDTAASRVEGAHRMLDGRMPATDVALGLRERWHPGNKRKSATRMLHAVGYAIDYRANDNPHLTDPRLRKLIEMRTGRPPHLQLGERGPRRAQIAAMGRATAGAGIDADSPLGTRAFELISSLDLEIAALAEASRSFTTDLPETLEELVALRRSLRDVDRDLTKIKRRKPRKRRKAQPAEDTAAEAALAAQKAEIEERIEEISADLPSLFAPWIEDIDEERAGLEAEAAEVDPVDTLASIPSRDALTAQKKKAGAERDAIARDQRRAEREVGRLEGKLARERKKVTESEALIARAEREIDELGPAAASPRGKRRVAQLTARIAAETKRVRARRAAVDELGAALGAAEGNAGLFAGRAHAAGAALEHLIFLEREMIPRKDAWDLLRALSAGLGKRDFVFRGERSAENPSVMQLVERGFFNVDPEPGPGEAFDPARHGFGAALFEAMIMHGFEAAAAWKPGSTDPMHFELVEGADALHEPPTEKRDKASRARASLSPAEALMVAVADGLGITDDEGLTGVLFTARHPDLTAAGVPEDPALSAEWMRIRAFVALATGREVPCTLTSYHPEAKGKAAVMEGGKNDRLGHPAHTLEQHLADPARHPYVAVSGDDAIFPYGQRVRIAYLEEKYGPQIVTRIVDTGGHFRGKGKVFRFPGSEPLDVATAVGKGFGVVRSRGSLVPGDVLTTSGEPAPVGPAAPSGDKPSPAPATPPPAAPLLAPAAASATPAKASPAKAPSLQPLSGATTPGAYYNLRKSPGAGSSADILGALDGIPRRLSVTGKKLVGKDLWLEVTLREPIGAVPSGTTAWITAAGVTAVAPWDLFLRQLGAWEAEHANLDLAARITALRRMSHPSNLPFDDIIGTPRDRAAIYLDQRPPVEGEWQLLSDYQIATTPDGRNVDIYHLLVGLDVLPRRVEQQAYWMIPIGSNYSAATWSGDIGAAVADIMLHKDKEWESRHPSAGTQERFEHYYETRAPESDLLADLDAWGADAARTKETTSVRALLEAYFGATTAGGQRTLTEAREAAIRLFLHNYGFTFDFERDGDLDALVRQERPRLRVRREIELFAGIWHFRGAPMSGRKTIDGYLLDLATLTFLRWLAYQAIENGVSM